MPAEWEATGKILMAYPGPHTDWDYILGEACAQFDALLSALLEAGEKVMLVKAKGIPLPAAEITCNEGLTVIEDVAFNDTWTRDYGPLTVEENGRLLELDFGFNGWGLKFAADKDNLVNIHLVENGDLEADAYRNCRDFTLEGGSIESDGRGTILTTSLCLCSPNRNGGKGKKEIEERLREYFGAERVLWLDHGFLAGDDTDSHIDTLARLAPDDTIIYVAPPEDETDIHFSELKKMEAQLREFRTAEGRPYRLIPLPFPEAEYADDGERLPATYANYLVTACNLFIPIYGHPEKDAEAVSQIQTAFPAHKVFAVDCRVLIRQHGSLHCSTMQLYK